MICTEPVQQVSAQEPTLYLTFDDGPSNVTLDILDTLEEKDVLATFFIQGSTLTTASNQEILKQAYDAGHTIGVHTYSHVYSDIYSSVEAFLDDFYQVWSLIYEITGEAPNIFRFPGGSINSYNSTIHQEIISEMLRRGFVYFDWNASSDDATASYVSSEGAAMVRGTINGNLQAESIVVDGGSITAETVTASGNVEIAKSSNLTGNITCGSISLHAKIVGDLIVSGNCILHSTAVVEGTLKAASLSVAAGATLKGLVEITG